MTDEPNVPIPPTQAEPSTSPAETNAPEAPEAGPTANEAWEDVVTRLRDLGEAISAWTKAAADTPENRKHLEEVRSGVNEIGRQTTQAFTSVTSGDFGRQVSEGATQVGQAIGDTAHEFGQAAAPVFASAFAGLSEAFGRAAQKVEESAAQRAEAPAEPAAEPQAQASAEPAAEPNAAPAPSAPQPPVAPATPPDGPSEP
jgi:sulfite reductase alpha subunit-like flavoprotein